MFRKLLGYQLDRYRKLAQQGQGHFTSAAVMKLLGHIKELDDDIRIRDIAMNKMTEQLDQAREDERRAVAAADRLKDNVIQLNREKRELEEKLEAADELVRFEEKKVVLPQELAWAIEHFEFLDERDSLFDIAYVTKCAREFNNRHAQVITEFVEETAGNKIAYFNGIINGYTVDEAPSVEDRLRTELTPKIEEWLRIPAEMSSAEAKHDLLKLIVPVVRLVLAEDRQAETQ